MIDVDEVRSNLSYLCQVYQKLHHCAITTNLHIDGLSFLTIFVRMDSYCYSDDSLQIQRISDDILQSCRETNFISLDFIFRGILRSTKYYYCLILTFVTTGTL